MYPSNDPAAAVRLAQYVVDERVADAASRRAAWAAWAARADRDRPQVPEPGKARRPRLRRVWTPRLGH